MNFRFITFSVTTWMFLLVMVSLLGCNHGIEVLEWSEPNPGPASGITLKSPGNVTMRESTTCFRFINTLLTKDQLLVSFKGNSLGIGTSISKRYSLYHYDSKTMPWYENLDIVSGLFWKEKTNKIVHFEFPEWPLQSWNCFCFTLSFQAKKMTIFLNGNLVLSTNFNVDNILEDNFFVRDFNFMGRNKGRYPVIGKIADINIWSKPLTTKKMVEWSHCYGQLEGDISKGDISQLPHHGVKVVQENNPNFCLKPFVENYSLTFIPGNTLDYSETIEFCHYLGGQIAVALTEVKANKMFAALIENHELCGPYIFSGFKNDAENPMFVSVVDRRPLDWSKWLPKQPDNFGGNEHCATIKLLNKKDCTWGLNDNDCKRATCPICDLPDHLQLHLRGVCPEQGIETVFYLGPTKKEQERKNDLMGYRERNKISWNPENKEWTIYDVKSNIRIATTNRSTEYPFGSQLWYFEDDKCFDKNDRWRRLNLHRKANNNEFCCLNGLCIDSSLRCDTILHCKDSSDEFNCTVLVIPHGYDQAKPPPSDKFFPMSGKAVVDPTKIVITITVFDISDIDEYYSTITVRFNMMVEWNDPRLKFRDLNANSKLNIINASDIWHPIFETPSSLKESRTSEVYDTIVVKEDNFSKFNEKDEIIRVHIYDGLQNPIRMSKTEQLELYCDFDDIYHYPFDEEVCSLNMTLKNIDNTFAKLDLHIVPKSPGIVSHYTIRKWEIGEDTDGGEKLKFNARVFLNRKTPMILITVYLPTLLLNIISQATNYLNYEGSSYFGVIMQVNITTMTVLAIIYRSVSTALPPTTTIKMIEVWLLSSLIYPFLIIVINIGIHKLGAQEEKPTTSTVSPLRRTNKPNIEPVDITFPMEGETASRPCGVVKIISCLKHNTRSHNLKIISYYILPFLYVIYAATYFCIALFM